HTNTADRTVLTKGVVTRANPPSPAPTSTPADAPTPLHRTSPPETGTPYAVADAQYARAFQCSIPSAPAPAHDNTCSASPHRAPSAPHRSCTAASAGPPSPRTPSSPAVSSS